MEGVLTALAPSAAEALPELCRRFHVRRLDLFGSAADGRFDPSRSDLDFLVTFENDAPRGLRGSYFSLLEALTERFGRDVDLLTESTVKNPYLRRRSNRSGFRFIRTHDLHERWRRSARQVFANQDRESAVIARSACAEAIQGRATPVDRHAAKRRLAMTDQARSNQKNSA